MPWPWEYPDRPYVKEKFRVDADGYVHAPTDPGMGYPLDMAVVDKLLIRIDPINSGGKAACPKPLQPLRAGAELRARAGDSLFSRSVFMLQESERDGMFAWLLFWKLHVQCGLILRELHLARSQQLQFWILPTP